MLFFLSSFIFGIVLLSAPKKFFHHVREFLWKYLNCFAKCVSWKCVCCIVIYSKNACVLAFERSVFVVVAVQRSEIVNMELWTLFYEEKKISLSGARCSICNDHTIDRLIDGKFLSLFSLANFFFFFALVNEKYGKLNGLIIIVKCMAVISKVFFLVLLIIHKSAILKWLLGAIIAGWEFRK